MKLAQIPFSEIDIDSSGGDININNMSLNPGDIVNAALPYVFTIAGLLVLFYLIFGGYHYIISMGDPKGLQEAKGKILNAIIGFVVIFLAYWIVELLGSILGIPGWEGVF